MKLSNTSKFKFSTAKSVKMARSYFPEILHISVGLMYDTLFHD